jgi:hypothetical protein
MRTAVAAPPADDDERQALLAEIAYLLGAVPVKPRQVIYITNRVRTTVSVRPQVELDPDVLRPLRFNRDIV